MGLFFNMTKRPERPERSERSERPERPEWPERPEKSLIRAPVSASFGPHFCVRKFRSASLCPQLSASHWFIFQCSTIFLFISFRHTTTFDFFELIHFWIVKQAKMNWTTVIATTENTVQYFLVLISMSFLLMQIISFAVCYYIKYFHLFVL